MLTRIVVLYIAYLLQLPTWCKALMFVGIGLDLMRFGYGFCKGINKIPDLEEH